MPAHPIRLLAESKNASRDLRDEITGEALFCWRGVDIELQLALSDYGRFLLKEDVGTITIEIKHHAAHAADFALVRKEFEAENCDATFTAAAWEGGGKQLLTASITKEESALPPGNYRIIILHEKEGTRNTYASSTLRVLDSQSAYDGVQPPPEPGAWLDQYRIYPRLILDHPPINGNQLLLLFSEDEPFLTYQAENLNPLVVDKQVMVTRSGTSLATGLPIWTHDGAADDASGPRIAVRPYFSGPDSSGWEIKGINGAIAWAGWNFPDLTDLPPTSGWVITNFGDDPSAEGSVTVKGPTQGKVGQSAFFEGVEYICTSIDPIRWTKVATSFAELAINPGDFATTTPQLGEIRALGGQKNCLVRGDGESPAQDLKINGTFEIVINEDWLTTNGELVDSGRITLPFRAQHLHVQIPIDLTAFGISQIQHHADCDVATFIVDVLQTDSLYVFAGEGSQDYFDVEGGSLGSSAYFVNANAFLSTMRLFGEARLVIGRKEAGFTV